MKMKYAFLSILLTFTLILPMSGKGTGDEKATTDVKQHHMSKMMGKPTADATVEGVHMRVWLMTQKQHKKMMKEKMGHMMMDKDMKEMKHDGMKMNDTSMEMGKDMNEMKHDGMEMNKAMMDSMMAGTHCIMLEVTDVVSKKGISDATAKVMIESPSKKHSSVDLKPMMKHYGIGITLDEKGKYQFTVNVNVGEISKTTAFQYIVK